MEDTSLLELCVEEEVIQALCTASNSSTLENSLETLIQVSRNDGGRGDLASKRIIAMVIQLLRSVPYPSGRQLLLLSLRLLRNLCAGEIRNQNSFVEQNGVGALLNVLRSARVCEVDCGIVRAGLQVLANVSLAGEHHKRAIWDQFFPQEFLALAKILSREVCDPLCMLIYTCNSGSSDASPGLPIVREIVKTTAFVGFGEDWLKLLLSRVCLETEQSNFALLFSELGLGGSDASRSTEQGFLLRMVSEIVNERLEESGFSVSSGFAECVLRIFESSIGVLKHGARTKSGLPTGCAETDVLGYSLTVLRDICARESPRNSNENSAVPVDKLISAGLVELLLSLLRSIEPPTIVKKAVGEGTSSSSSTPCPYKGFRRDMVAVIGNCAYQRKHVQDDIRHKDGILLLLQQCVADEENPFLREWGIWSVRNLLEGNAENQRAVAELEIRGSVDAPELAGLGLRVEVDPNSGRAKLVNISGMKQSPAV